jgi:hypothetical protein
MLASQSIATGGNTISMNEFVEGQLLPEANSSKKYPHHPFAYQNDYHWAEQLYRTGDMVAVVAVYQNIPKYLQRELDQLVSETYRKKLLTVPFLEASLLLLASGVLPEFKSLSERSTQFCPASCLEFEQQKAIDFVTGRNPNDIVVMVLRSDRLIATMTLFPFNRRHDIPSLSYLEVDPVFEQLPDVPALEVGRLAKTTCNGYHLDDPENSFIDMASMAAAFIVSELFVSRNGMLRDPQSFICGDTHGTLITSLKRFFPLTVFDSRINPDMLKDDSDARGMSIYFIQRQVLGSFESADDLLAAIQNVADANPDRANRIEALLDSGLDTLGVSSIHQFDPKRFRVHFFHFPFHHPKTLRGLARMEQMMQWMTSRPSRPKRILN